MIFSVVNSFLKFVLAKNFLLKTNFSISFLASFLVILKGKTVSGTLPFGICSFIDKVLRHQWHLDVRAWLVSTTTSAPQLEHFKVNISLLSLFILVAPLPITLPFNLLISFSMPSSLIGSNSWRQKLQRSLPVLEFKDISVAPHLGHLFWPSSKPFSVFTILFSVSLEELEMFFSNSSLFFSFPIL